VLLVLRRDSLATTWLRWAARLSPEFNVDEDVAPPSVVRAARAARAFVDSTPRDPFVASTEFHWPGATVTEGPGTVRLAAANIPITARIGPDQFLRGAESRRLPPGSYDVVVSAPGYLPTRLTVELLPGVETLVRVSLLPETAGLLYVAARPWVRCSLTESESATPALRRTALPPATTRFVYSETLEPPPTRPSWLLSGSRSGCRGSRVRTRLG